MTLIPRISADTLFMLLCSGASSSFFCLFHSPLRSFVSCPSVPSLSCHQCWFTRKSPGSRRRRRGSRPRPSPSCRGRALWWRWRPWRSGSPAGRRPGSGAAAGGACNEKMNVKLQDVVKEPGKEFKNAFLASCG